MGPEHLKFGGGAAATTVNPLFLLLALIAGIVILIASRQKALAAFLVAGILIPLDQVLVLSGMHLPMLRVLILFGLARVLREPRHSEDWLFAGGFNKLDRSVVLLPIFVAINGIVLFHEVGEAIYQAGNLLQFLGIYLILRLLIRSEEDAAYGFRILLYICLVLAVFMAYEHRTGDSVYAFLGGSHASTVSHILERDGKFRAQGPFGHSILAGTFGAVLIPLFWSLALRQPKYRGLAITGIFAAFVMATSCNSSTPVIAGGAGLFALCLWSLRHWTTEMRRGLVVTLVALQLVMKHPIWHLMVSIDVVGGSSGYHRYMLIDQCIRNFWHWCLFGVKSTSSWGWDMWDTANEYVGTCDNSGLIPFILLISILVYGFKYLGRARMAAELAGEKRSAQFIWAVGAALFANLVAFFGISYWDQTQVGWLALLAAISGILASRKSRMVKPTRLLPFSTSTRTKRPAEQPACVEV